MISKSYSKTGRSCRVTFKIPAEQVDAQVARSVAVLGEFNGWNADATPMEKRKDGSFSASVTIEAGRPYRFRYLLDGQRWANDEAPDAMVPNQFGSEDSVLSLEEAGRPEPVAAQKATGAGKSVKPAKSARNGGRPGKAPAKAAKTTKAPRAGKRSEPKEH
jgi:1,4-alpha-glucan branching enzyme